MEDPKLLFQIYSDITVFSDEQNIIVILQSGSHVVCVQNCNL